MKDGEEQKIKERRGERGQKCTNVATKIIHKESFGMITVHAKSELVKSVYKYIDSNIYSGNVLVSLVKHGPLCPRTKCGSASIFGFAAV